MTGRLRRVSDDEGSALAIALVFLMIFGTYVGFVLQFALTGQRTTTTIRDEAAATYAGGGAIDGAINAVRTTLSTGVDPGTAPIPATTCFTLPAGSLDNTAAVTVSCQPRTGSGTSITSSTSQPAQAVLSLATVATEGVTLGAASTLRTQGAVNANSRISVPSGSTLTSTGAVTAGTCSVLGTSNPACAVAADPGDPGYAAPTAYPALRTPPACTASSLVTLLPGTYQSAAALQTVLNCASKVVWFTPGTYSFDFRDVGTHQLAVGNGDVLVGGTALGWTPGTTAPASVPFPTAASPNASACDTTAAGVDFVFGADSGLALSGTGKVQLCALNTGSSSQHIVVHGLTSTVNLPGASASPVTTSTSSDLAPGGGARSWTNASQGAVVDGNPASVVIDGNSRPASQLLVGPVTSPLVPSDATNVSVTATVAESMGGRGTTSLVARPGDGSASTAAQTLHNCTVAGACTAGGLVAGQTDAVTYSGLTPAKANGMSFVVFAIASAATNFNAWVDGITVTVTYTAPLRPTSGTSIATPYVSGSASTTPVLSASGASAVLALHGTVYAPLAALDLALTLVPYTVIDRGVVVRHLQSGLTPAAAFAGPLISVPSLGQAPRQLLMLALDSGGQTLVRAEVTFADAAGLANGVVPRVTGWSVS